MADIEDFGITPTLDENVSKDWGPIKQWFVKLRFQGVSTIMIHHEGKGKTGPRGTSSREDNIDSSIILRKPKDYEAHKDGCRFIVNFSKQRIDHKHLDYVTPVEMKLVENSKGFLNWVTVDVKRKSIKDILKMLDEGMKQSEIAQELKVTRPYVNKVKNKAQRDGLLDEHNRLTIIGRSRI